MTVLPTEVEMAASDLGAALQLVVNYAHAALEGGDATDFTPRGMYWCGRKMLADLNIVLRHLDLNEIRETDA